MKSIKFIIFTSLITSVPFLKAMDSHWKLTASDLELISSDEAWAAERQWVETVYKPMEEQREAEEKEELRPLKTHILEQLKKMSSQEITALTDDELRQIMSYDTQALKPPVSNTLFTLAQFINNESLSAPIRRRIRLFACRLHLQESDDPNDIRYSRYTWLMGQRTG